MHFKDCDSITLRIAFSMIRGLNYSTACHTFDLMDGDISTYFESSEEMLQRRFNIKSSIISYAYRQQLLEDAVKERNFVVDNGIETHFFNDEDYPFRLSACDDSPAMLYKIGKTNLNTTKIVAVVGTRHATPYGLEMANRIVKDLADEYGTDLLIVSGLAYGIDVAAHKAALAANVPTVAVAAHPLNTIYPAEHRSIAKAMINSGGAIITEYPTNRATHKGNFLARNRIIAGMSDCTVIIESDIKGGAMVTARIASAYGRDVFAVPGRCNDRFSRGCNKLITDQCAMLAGNGEDIIRAMGWESLKPEGAQHTLALSLTGDQTKVLNHLKKNPDDSINQMVIGLGMDFPKLTSVLFELEMSDLIVSIPGARYAITSLAAEIE